MPFTFSPVKPLDTGRVSTDEIPLGTYLSNAFTQGVHDSFFSSAMNMEELALEREGQRLSPDEANQKYGLPGLLTFDRQVYDSEARVMRERKDAELKRAFYMDMGAPGGLWSRRGLAGLGAGFVGSILNPLDFSINFIPIVGSEAAALRMGAMGKGGFRATLARGLLTEEAIARSVPAAPKLASAMIQGFAASTIVEVPHLMSAIESKENYTIQDTVTNVVAGGVLSGALYLGFKQAAKIYNRLRPHTQETMLRTAVDQFVKGQDINVTKFVHIDEGAIRESVKFDESQARQKAMREVDDAEVRRVIKEQYDETPVKAAFRLSDGRILTGDAHYTIDLEQVPDADFNGMQEGFVTDKGRFVSREEAFQISNYKRQLGAEEFAELTSEDLAMADDPGSWYARDRLVYNQVRAAGATHQEALAEARRLIKERNDAAFFERPDIVQKVEDETNRRVQEVIDRERQQYDEQGKFIAARDVEIQRQIKEGRVLSQDQLKEWDLSKKTTEDATALIKEQNNELIQELEELEDLVETMKEEEMGIDKGTVKRIEEIKQKLEKQKKGESKAAEQAAKCIIANS